MKSDSLRGPHGKADHLLKRKDRGFESAFPFSQPFFSGSLTLRHTLVIHNISKNDDDESESKSPNLPKFQSF